MLPFTYETTEFPNTSLTYEHSIAGDSVFKDFRTAQVIQLQITYVHLSVRMIENDDELGRRRQRLIWKLR